jgi:hypothetical protein
MLEFVIVGGPVLTARQKAELSAEMDEYGDEGFMTVAITTVVHDGVPHATIVMEKHVDHDYPTNMEFSVLDGGAG